MANYEVKYTDLNKTPISIPEGDFNNTSTDTHLFGRTKLEYGEQLNENILHLLENFASPELSGGTEFNANPDFINATYNNLLSHPSDGQLWYNTTRKRFYFFDGSNWIPISNRDDYAANWGVIYDGFSLPKPVSATTGRVFEYSECIWSVAPANLSGKTDFLVCATDNNALVNMKFRYVGDSILTSGVANYLIIGIKGNTNYGTNVTPVVPTPTPTPAVTPTPTFDPAVSPTPTAGISPTPTVTVTATPAVTPTNTVTPTPSRSVGATPEPTPTKTPSATNTPTPAPSQTRTPAVTPTQTPPGTPAVTPTPVAPMTASFRNGNSSSNPANSPPFGSTLNSLESYCDVAVHTTNSYTYFSCSGQTLQCLSGKCAPKPGDLQSGPELRITVQGGVPPYTVQFKNWSGGFSPAVSSCVVLFGAGDVVPVQSNSSGNITSSPTYSKTINSSGGSVGNYIVVGQCGAQDMDGSGTFNVVITDSNGSTITRTLSWSLSRYNTNN